MKREEKTVDEIIKESWIKVLIFKMVINMLNYVGSVETNLQNIFGNGKKQISGGARYAKLQKMGMRKVALWVWGVHQVCKNRGVYLSVGAPNLKRILTLKPNPNIPFFKKRRGPIFPKF